MHSHDWLLLGIGKWTQHRDGISILPVRFDFLIILFVYFRLSWVLVAVPLFPCYSERVILFVVEPGLLTAAASLSWSTSSRRLGFRSCSSQVLEHRLSGCGTRAYLLRSMWDLPRSGMEPGSPALAGIVFTTIRGSTTISEVPIMFVFVFIFFLSLSMHDKMLTPTGSELRCLFILLHLFFFSVYFQYCRIITEITSQIIQL